jgi:hypothetical protein
MRPGSLAPLRSLLPSIGITKRRLKHLEAVRLIREQRDNGKQDLAYNARPFVLCGIPLRRPPQNQLLHTRRNGRFFLQIAAHPQFGLPFGQDRLIPVWIATLAVRNKTREVHFNTGAQMLDFFRLPKDGPHYRRLLGGFMRLFAATIFFGTQEQPDHTAVVDWARFHFFDRMRLWFNRDESRNSSPTSEYDNVIVLSDAFYREIDGHRIPVEREVVSALTHAPGVLDLYLWLAWKSWTTNGTPAYIPLFGHNGLKHQLGCKDYSTDKRFRQSLHKWIGRIKVLWPQCPAVITADGRLLVVRSCRNSAAVKGSSGQ